MTQFFHSARPSVVCWLFLPSVDPYIAAQNMSDSIMGDPSDVT